MSHRGPAACLVLAVALSACGEAAPTSRLPTRVGVETATVSDYAPTVVLTGEVVARVSSDLSFRVSGRVLERKAEVGDHVTADQTLAALDPQEQRANFAAAQADVDSAGAKLRQATSSFERQKQLIGQGFTTRREYDQADEDMRSAQGNLDVAKASLGNAQDQLNQTTLRPGVAGIITARNVEAGQVVQSAQTAFTLAQDGPRDAVFNVYESIFINEPTAKAIQVALVSNPDVKSEAKAREISPVVDSSGGTVKVKFEIVDPPPAMTLGAPVSGMGQLKARQRIMLSWRALSADGGKPAVWVVDPASKAVSLRPVAIEAYERDRIVVREGLEGGQMVVTRGQQLLRPGEVIEPVEEGKS